MDRVVRIFLQEEMSHDSKDVSPDTQAYEKG